MKNKISHSNSFNVQNNQNNKNNKNKGFTLVEVIISIAVLSILCVIFLQLFVKANDISKKSHAIDQSIRIVSSQIESLKGYGNLSVVKKSEEFSWMTYSVEDGSDVFKGNLTKDFIKNSDDTYYQLFISLEPVKNESDSSRASIQLFQVTGKIIHMLKGSSEVVIYQTKAQVILEN